MQTGYRAIQLAVTLTLLLVASQATAHGQDWGAWRDLWDNMDPVSVSQATAHGQGWWWEPPGNRENVVPVVTYSPEDSVPGVPIAPSGEVYLPPTEERMQLHADSHEYTPIVTATLPPLFEPPAMDALDDFIMHKDDLVVVNPAPDEFLWIMEGQRHGFENLTIVLTNTQTGNGAPLHTHVGEEAHILLHGKMLYVINGEEITVEAPYIINIPSMVPHAFMNIDDDPAELVGVFPDSNHWEYDVLKADVFTDVELKAAASHHDHVSGARRRHTVHGYPDADAAGVTEWYSEQNRVRRMEAYRNRDELSHDGSAEPPHRHQRGGQ